MPISALCNILVSVIQAKDCGMHNQKNSYANTFSYSIITKCLCLTKVNNNVLNLDKENDS